MKHVWLIFALACTPACAAPVTVQAVYDVYISGMKVGQIDENYSAEGGHYTLTSVTTPQGLLAAFRPGKIYITSEGDIDGRGLHPHSFDDRREGNPEKNSAARFDWEHHQLNLSRPPQQLPLPDGTQDRLSAMYQFMYTTFLHQDTLSFAMTNGSKLDNYRYAIGQLQQLTTPAGKFEVRYLDSQGKPGENHTEIWLETQYNLPCKMVITDTSGERMSQILSALKITP